MWDMRTPSGTELVKVPIPETSFLSRLLKLRKLWCKTSKKRTTARTQMMMFTETEETCVTSLYLGFGLDIKTMEFGERENIPLRNDILVFCLTQTLDTNPVK